MSIAFAIFTYVVPIPEWLKPIATFGACQFFVLSCVGWLCAQWKVRRLFRGLLFTGGATVAIGIWWFMLPDKSPNKLLAQQKRLEFLQHRGDMVRRVSFVIWLDRAYTADELGPFIILLQILGTSQRVMYLSNPGTPI